jgi:hypothetical protein
MYKMSTSLYDPYICKIKTELFRAMLRNVDERVHSITNRIMVIFEDSIDIFPMSGRRDIVRQQIAGE